jgi:Uma2 family endonuclease
MYAHKLEYLPSYTYGDYLKWEGNWELIYGVPYAMSPSPSMAHQRAGKALLLIIEEQLKGCSECESFYELDWKIGADTVVRPDLMIVCKPFEEGDFNTKTPEFVVEIFSPSTANRDRTLKYDLYEKQGVRYYMIVYPEKKSAEVFEIKDGKYQRLEIPGEHRFRVSNCELKLDMGRVW